MAERDDLEGLPSIAASPDDDPGRREARPAAAPRAAASVAPTPPARASAIPVPLVVVLALIVLGSVGFGYVQSQQLQLANTQLTNATERIRRLEEELNVTGSTLNETSTSTKEKITEQQSETKRLWDSSRANHTAINDTRRALGKTDAALKATTDRTAAAEALAAQQAKELEQQRAQLARANEAIRALAAANRDLVDKVNAADQTARALRSSLERRMRDNEEAIAAVDKFRMQINRTISALSSDVAALKAGGKPAG